VEPAWGLAPLFSVADDFNDKRKDPSIWCRKDDAGHAGVLTERRHRLEYTVDRPTRRWDYAGWPLVSGTPYDITWATNATAAPVDHVALSWSRDGGRSWMPIDTSADPGDDGSFTWTPSVAVQKTSCKVRLMLRDGAGKNLGADTSNGVFTIDPAP